MRGRIETAQSDDGTPIAFRRGGAGRALLLVHGATADHSTTWRVVGPLLESHATVVAMDRRGRGASGDATAYALQREAEDVAAVVRAIGGPVAVLGHSYGALCAIEAARLDAGISRLILYEGVPRRGADGVSPAAADRLEDLTRAGELDRMLETFYREVAGLGPEDIGLLRAQRDAWTIRLRNARTLPRELREEARYVFDPARFAHLTSPTLLLVGAESPGREHANATAVAAALPNAHVAVLPGQQHVAMHTAPEAFVNEVVRFLNA